MAFSFMIWLLGAGLWASLYAIAVRSNRRRYYEY